MSINLILLLTFAGGALGAIFFGGLWWTVRRGVASRASGLWFFGSLQIRMAITLVGFYFLIGGDAERVFPSLVGFVIARFVVVAVTKGASLTPVPAQKRETL